MAIQKEDILEKAIEAFRENGYQNTSVQDVADRCGISKASFYSFFPSKDDVFIAAFIELQDSYRRNIALLLETQLDARKRFEYSSQLTLDLFSKNTLILRSSTNPEPDIIIDKKREFGAWILTLFHDLIEGIYGPAISEYAWELTFVHRGLQREFANLICDGSLGPLSTGQCSAYIAQTIEAIAESKIEDAPDPLVTQPIADSYLALKNGDGIDAAAYLESFEQNVAIALEGMHGSQRESDILSMAEFFIDEIKSGSPRWFLLHAIVDSFGTQKELRGVARQLRKLLASIAPEENAD